jgi:hypothetical protein
MNCPNCKNSIKENSTECEWCGNMIVFTNSEIINFKKNKIKIKIEGGGSSYKNSIIDIFINESFKCKESMSENIFLEIENKNEIVKIKFKSFLINKTVEIPKLDLNKNYLIEFKYGWIGYFLKSIKEIA